MAHIEGNRREPGTQAGRDAGMVFASSLLERSVALTVFGDAFRAELSLAMSNWSE